MVSPGMALGLGKMKRIAIMGWCGAGKSTLARRLGELLDLPVIHIDVLNWNPGWIDTPLPQLREKVRVVALADEWIIDGNYSVAHDVRLPRADTIVFLDLPRLACLWRVIKRVVRYYGVVRPDLGEGCPEKWDWEFIEFIWNQHDTGEAKRIKWLLQYGAGKSVYHLRSQREINRFVHEIEMRQGSQSSGN
jgi:adenylate kinase family enzyme